MHGIRAATSPHHPHIDDPLIALPIKLDRLGTLSFKTCATLAYAVSFEARDALFAPLLATTST